MTNQELRIAIAEACGWIKCNREGYEGYWMPGGYRYNYSPYSLLKKVDEIPDYPNDLNAMHEAEKTLNDKEQVWYLQKLTQVQYKDGVGGMIACMVDKTTFATARQRAEAFLRVKGIWKE